MSVELTNLSNCILEKLLSYLDATSLYNLSRTCERLHDFIGDSTVLWKEIDARGSPNVIGKVNYCTKKVHQNTRSLLLRDQQHDPQIIIPQTLNPQTFDGLKILVLECVTINGNNFKMDNMPKGLVELSLRRSYVKEWRNFFRQSFKGVKNLRVLILDECSWLQSSFLMATSKYASLEILSMAKCPHMDSSIPYLSMSGQYGFRNLKVLDARLTPLGNSLLRSFYRSQSLLAVYLQNNDISYKLDYYKRKLEIMHGEKLREYPMPIDDEFDLPNEKLEVRPGLRNRYRMEWSNELDDRGLYDYGQVTSKKTVEEFPKSELYLDPYTTAPCICQRKDASFSAPTRLPKTDHRDKIFNDNPGVSDSSSSDSDDDDDDDDDNPRKQLKAVKRIIGELNSVIRQNDSNARRSFVRDLSDINYATMMLEDYLSNEANTPRYGNGIDVITIEYNNPPDEGGAGGDEPNGDENWRERSVMYAITPRHEGDQPNNEAPPADEDVDRRGPSLILRMEPMALRAYRDRAETIRQQLNSREEEASTSNHRPSTSNVPGGRDYVLYEAATAEGGASTSGGGRAGESSGVSSPRVPDIELPEEPISGEEPPATARRFNQGAGTPSTSKSTIPWVDSDENEKSRNQPGPSRKRGSTPTPSGTQAKRQKTDMEGGDAEVEAYQDHFPNRKGRRPDTPTLGARCPTPPPPPIVEFHHFPPPAEVVEDPVLANNRPPKSRFDDHYAQDAQPARPIIIAEDAVIRILNINHAIKHSPVPLRRLSFRGYTRITNKALHYLKDLELEVLDLTYTSVTPDAINTYLVDHPYCRVLHESLCTCPPHMHF